MLFTSLPQSAVAGHPFSAQLQLMDQYGNLATNDSSIVTLSLGAHSGNSIFSGSTSVAVNNGIADLDHLILKSAGQYTLVATDSRHLPKQTSRKFTVNDTTT